MTAPSLDAPSVAGDLEALARRRGRQDAGKAWEAVGLGAEHAQHLKDVGGDHRLARRRVEEGHQAAIQAAREKGEEVHATSRPAWLALALKAADLEATEDLKASLKRLDASLSLSGVSEEHWRMSMLSLIGNAVDRQVISEKGQAILERHGHAGTEEWYQELVARARAERWSPRVWLDQLETHCWRQARQAQAAEGGHIGTPGRPADTSAAGGEKRMQAEIDQVLATNPRDRVAAIYEVKRKYGNR